MPQRGSARWALNFGFQLMFGNVKKKNAYINHLMMINYTLRKSLCITKWQDSTYRLNYLNTGQKYANQNNYDLLNNH